jgi:glycosyltransferase involved in cell wall biosynthesis
MILSHPTGNQNVRNAALALHRANLLDRFYTTVAWDDDSRLATLLPRSVLATLRRREYGMVPRDKLRTRPAREACRLVAIALRLGALTRAEAAPCSVDAVYRDLDRHVARELEARPTDGIYAYEDGAVKTFEIARKLGIRTTYEVASAYWRAGVAILSEEAELNPDWAVTMGALGYSVAKTSRRDEEIALADRVVVASRFTAENLRLGPFEEKPVAVIPYGAPTPAAAIRPSRDSGRLKVLFVGGLSQGKGLSYLFAAAESVERAVSLTVIGRRHCGCAALDRRLAKCRYVASLPHDEVLDEMARHDVLVFPSLWDGFGLVILEALSQGMPVIASTNSGGPDVITDGVDGFIVPIRSAEEIAAKLELLAGDTDLLNQMKHAALATARRYSWARYRDALVDYVA